MVNPLPTPVTSALRCPPWPREGKPAGGPPGARAGAGAQVGPTPNGLERWGSQEPAGCTCSDAGGRTPTAGTPTAVPRLTPRAAGPRRPEGGQQCCHHEASVDPGKGSVDVLVEENKSPAGISTTPLTVGSRPFLEATEMGTGGGRPGGSQRCQSPQRTIDPASTDPLCLPIMAFLNTITSTIPTALFSWIV